jgi:acetyltransferase/esterase
MMSVLEVPGARLFYELRGAGPLLVMVPGASGDGTAYQRLAGELSGRYQVVTYDRRGFSRSQLHGAQDYEHRLQIDADDVRRLIEQLSGEPATVFGNSSGALVALDLLIHHPTVVATVIAHEPPAMRLLPDADRWVAFFDSVYDTYRTSGIHPALQQFAKAIADGPDRVAMANARDPNKGSQIAANVLYWFERELRQYTRAELDLEALAAHADRLVLAGGRESRQRITYQPNTVLAARLGKPIVDLPGGHVGLIMQPADFARELLDALGR